MSETLDSRDSTDARRGDMIYTIEDTPPWYLCVFLGLQVNLQTGFVLLFFLFSPQANVAKVELVGHLCMCKFI